MKLIRPLAFFDVETTGANAASDRIVELAIVRLMPGEGRDIWRSLINPGVPIPAGATNVHGITDADVHDSPTFQMVAREVSKFVDGADLAGFNILKFDLPLLEAEFARSKVAFTAEGRSLVDAMQLFYKFEPRDLSGAVGFYLGREFEHAHGALPDTQATIDVLLAQVARYQLPGDAASLAQLCVDPDAVDRDGKFKRVDGKVVFAFGKHKGRDLSEVVTADGKYLEWILGGEFSESTKNVVRDAVAEFVFARVSHVS